MADRKPTPTTSKKPPAKAAAKAAAKAPTKAPAKAPSKPAAKRPPTKPGKSIVNQKQTPWGLIATAVVIVLFAAVVITVAVTGGHKSKSTAAGNSNCTAMIGNNKDSYLNELQCAKDIQGVTFKAEPNRDHVKGVVNYDSTPPVGGNHSPYWADCTGTVYADAIASENAVHSLEHGAVWITYRPGIPQSDITTLSAMVNGRDRLLMSPFPTQTAPISIQSWGYQLTVNSATDPRLQTFIKDLAYNPKTTPEYGATCSQPTFKAHPSTFGKPLSDAVGGGGSTMGG